MEIRILGHLEIRHGVRCLAPTRRQARRLLGILALKANTPVSVEWIVEGLWNGHPPRSAGSNLRSYLADLRRQLGAGGPSDARIESRPGGYLLRTGPAGVDALRFTALVADGRRHLAEGDPGLAAHQLGRSLALWRGPLFGGQDLPEAVQPEARLLESQRLDAFEDCVEARLALRHHAELIGELRAAIVEHGLRERLWQQLMLALYRGGRQGDALAAYRELHGLLDQELGVRPGPDTQELQRRILSGDATLRARAHPGPWAPGAGHCGRDHAPGPRAAAGVVVPGQLPADVRGFTGRIEHLARLDAVLTATAQAPTAVAVCVLSGPAGVGKSALAVHWAHRIRERFPDGQLYLNLRGMEPDGRPADGRVPDGRGPGGPGTVATDAVGLLLDLLGVPPERVPTGPDARVGLYRSLLADRRMLVLLDDASDAEQVRPLIPGSPGCLVVVTSRDQMAPLVATHGAHPVVLGALTSAEAIELLARRIGGARLAAEPGAAERLVARCARMPAALATAAAQAALHPDAPLSGLAAEWAELAERAVPAELAGPAGEAR